MIYFTCNSLENNMVTADVLEHMKHRLADAHRRLQEATQRLQQAQQEHQAAAQEFSIWQGALQIEQKKQAQANAVPAQAVTANAPTPAQEQKVVASTEPTVSASEINKTEAIRELLAKNSTGMTPAEIW